LSNNQTALVALLGNHVGFLFSTPSFLIFTHSPCDRRSTSTALPATPPLLSPTSSSSTTEFISNSGQSFTFTSNSSGAYVISKNKSSAKIVKTDVLVNIGVVHVVDKVLVNTDVDLGRASAAWVFFLLLLFVFLTDFSTRT
jgi:hypothetical protein